MAGGQSQKRAGPAARDRMSRPAWNLGPRTTALWPPTPPTQCPAELLASAAACAPPAGRFLFSTNTSTSSRSAAQGHLRSLTRHRADHLTEALLGILDLPMVRSRGPANARLVDIRNCGGSEVALGGVREARHSSLSMQSRSLITASLIRALTVPSGAPRMLATSL